ncbi:type 1 glutamine amidotransferase [Bradyrhizobium uaiense]|uniref:Type 1 glutamine amidotransferase n=1 Tax=Bradyrhizobium uaiense TaxID=2594946 RepID=A0A6P1BPT6_9BRAD|nr:type 1 glutamine amidotransferase [Bradyrhizobium uaiense]NEU99591.1 type 1 glutamine amidotransferase [Bradyrhizobium uaiense]
MNILVFQHLPVEHPGTLRDFWRERGYFSYTVELEAGEPIPKLEEFDLLVVMGGPQDVWQEDIHPWLVPEKAAIRHWVRSLERPYLGICLGHQLLAEALDGRVGLMQRPEVGLAKVELTAEGHSDPLFDGFGGTMQTFQWHGAEVIDMPAGAVVLAHNDACAVQAIRWGRHAYGLQYHVEITPQTVGEWEAEPAYRASLEQSLGPVDAARLNDVVSPRLAEFRSAAKRINDNFFSILADRAAVRPV